MDAAVLAGQLGAVGNGDRHALPAGLGRSSSAIDSQTVSQKRRRGGATLVCAFLVFLKRSLSLANRSGLFRFDVGELHSLAKPLAFGVEVMMKSLGRAADDFQPEPLHVCPQPGIGQGGIDLRIQSL
jgi:hypothetical protein